MNTTLIAQIFHYLIFMSVFIFLLIFIPVKLFIKLNRRVKNIEDMVAALKENIKDSGKDGGD
ncbi:MAG: hypothetical protein C4589_06225 [Peptococcaceae bacterium]|nr:MAG: hypothetical protein C4589_06225 [Peptococcaceae bacterium]